MIKYVFYGRKSTDARGKQEQSLETQEGWKNEEIKKYNLDVVESIAISESATSPNQRSGFDKIIEIINSGKANAILAMHVDRIARNPVEDGQIRQLVRDGKLAEIRTSGKIFTRTELFMLTIEFEFANQYGMKVKERFEEGKETKKHNGAILHQVPIGYRHHDKQAIIDPEYAHYIPLIFNYRIDGLSMPDIAEKMNQLGMRSRKIGVKVKGGKKITKNVIERILSNPFYYGVVRIKDELFEGVHEPLITKEIFELANKNRKMVSFNSSSLSPIKGKVKYKETGEPLTVSVKKDKYVYFHLHGNKKQKLWVSQNIIYKQIEQLLPLYQFPEELKKPLLEKIKKKIGGSFSEGEKSKKSLERLIIEANKRKNRYTEMRADGELDYDDFLERKNQLVKDIAEMRNQISEIEEKEAVEMEVFSEMVELLSNPAQKWNNADVGIKGLLANHYYVELFLDHEKRLHVEENPLYSLLRVINGGSSEARTQDLLLKRELLYQLS